MKDIVAKVQDFCRTHDLLPAQGPLVIGCSGGPDSLVLLDILTKLRESYPLQLVVVYVHHGLRRAADDEVVQVRRAAEERQCQFVTVRVDVPALAARRKQSVETVGRDERYRVLRSVAAQYGARRIAVAHHQNDQAETVLLHLLRGSGLNGLGAMRPRAGDIIRPLLCVTRQEIETYVADQNLQPCRDETNEEPLFLRNRIRLDVIPFLQQYNPALIADLNRLAVVAQGDEEVLQEAAAKAYAAARTSCPDGIGLRKEQLSSLPCGLARRVIRLAIAELTGSTLNLSLGHVETVRQLAQKAGRKEFRSRYWQAYTTCDTVCIVRSLPRQPQTPSAAPVPIPGPGQYQLGSYTLSLQLAATPPAPPAVVFDADRLPFPLVLRQREPGDWLTLTGGTKKLKKYYIDKKIPQSLRNCLPLLCKGHEVLWLPGYAVSRHLVVTAQTRRYMVGTISRRTNECIQM